jgi:histidine triad (HIT) family protein
MSDCIFCQIASGKISCHKIFEDDSFIGFLDISPVIAGHVLIIPKKHYRWVHEVEEFGKFWEAAQKVAKAQIKGLKVPTVVFATAGLEIFHAHIHVLPLPSKQKGEYLPGVESARRIKVTSAQLQKIASVLRSRL